ncbi:MAG TPA: hypothetical protein VFN42_10390 [Acetobacteraceae bacterium]|nr:hypothetical protein [Acetobacteraceae bacterium]
MTRIRPRPPLLPNRGSQGNILLGMLRVALGKADGMAQFGGTRHSFLASLAPLVAFPLVGALLVLAGGKPLDALGELLGTLCVLLVPPVVSFELARLWRREDQWLHFATAFNWCYWLVPLLGMLLMFVVGLLTAAGLPEQVGVMVMVACLGGYGLWLHWFLALHGLHVSRLRAALLVVAINLVVAALVLGPRLLLMNRG